MSFEDVDMGDFGTMKNHFEILKKHMIMKKEVGVAIEKIEELVATRLPVTTYHNRENPVRTTILRTIEGFKVELGL